MKNYQNSFEIIKVVAISLLCFLVNCAKSNKMKSHSSWISDVKAFHEKHYPSEVSMLHLGAGASNEDLKLASNSMEVRFSPEINEFYSEVNGFGTRRNGVVDWFFVPLDKVSGLTLGVRETIEDTHPDVSKKFVGFVDWGNGDVSGCLVMPNGELSREIYFFEHELYEYRCDQDFSEFIYQVDSSVKHLLSLE